MGFKNRSCTCSYSIVISLIYFIHIGSIKKSFLNSCWDKYDINILQIIANILPRLSMFLDFVNIFNIIILDIIIAAFLTIIISIELRFFLFLSNNTNFFMAATNMSMSTAITNYDYSFVLGFIIYHKLKSR